MKKRQLLVVIVLVLGAGALVGARACSSIPADIGLANGRLRACPDKPNCVCSESDQGSGCIEPLNFGGDPEASFQSLLYFLEAEIGAEIVTKEARYMHAVMSTPLLGFRDDLEFRLDEKSSLIHVRSASRVGYSDMGTNRKRMETIRKLWKP